MSFMKLELWSFMTWHRDDHFINLLLTIVAINLTSTSMSQLFRCHRKKPMIFTHEEDQFLKTGLKKHGFLKWKCILGDSKLGFQEADLLKKRSLAKFNK